MLMLFLKSDSQNTICRSTFALKVDKKGRQSIKREHLLHSRSDGSSSSELEKIHPHA